MAFPVNVDSTWVNPGSVALDAGELRRADSAIFGGTGSPLGVRGGIVRHGDTSLAVTVDGSDVVTVQAGAVVIPGNAVSGTGCYRSALAASTTGNLTARNATNPRIDLVVFRQLDTDVVGTHGAYTARIEIIAGTPSATPSAPVLPSMAVELARISVPASGGGAVSVDSTFRTYANALGGGLAVPTGARLPASAAIGDRAIALDTLTRYTWDGAAWDDGTWKTWAPTLTGITLGNGTVIGRYRVIDSKTVVGRVMFNAGSTTTYAAGSLLFSMPPVAPLSTYDAVTDVLGHGNVNNNTSASRTTVEVMLVSGNRFLLALTGGLVTNANPFTFGGASRIGFSFMYETP